MPFLVHIEQLQIVTPSRSAVTRKRTRPQWHPPSKVVVIGAYRRDCHLAGEGNEHVAGTRKDPTRGLFRPSHLAFLCQSHAVGRPSFPQCWSCPCLDYRGRVRSYGSSSPFANNPNCDGSRAGSARPRCLNACEVISRPRGVRCRSPFWIRNGSMISSIASRGSDRAAASVSTPTGPPA